EHHDPADDASALLPARDRADRGAADLHPALRDDQRRAQRRDALLRALPLPERLPVLQDGLRLGAGLGAVRLHPAADAADPPLGARLGARRGRPAMTPVQTRALGPLGLPLVLLAGLAAVLMPIAFALSPSLKPYGDLFIYPPVWIPTPPRWSNYVEAL